MREGDNHAGSVGQEPIAAQLPCAQNRTGFRANKGLRKSGVISFQRPVTGLTHRRTDSRVERREIVELGVIDVLEDVTDAHDLFVVDPHRVIAIRFDERPGRNGKVLGVEFLRDDRLSVLAPSFASLVAVGVVGPVHTGFWSGSDKRIVWVHGLVRNRR